MQANSYSHDILISGVSFSPIQYIEKNEARCLIKREISIFDLPASLPNAYTFHKTLLFTLRASDVHQLTTADIFFNNSLELQLI